jgi:hypothetical protein
VAGLDFCSSGGTCAGGRLEWQAWIFAPLEGRQGHPGVSLLLGDIRFEGVGCSGAATTRYPDGILCEGPP